MEEEILMFTGTPEEYEPPYYMACKETYQFQGKPTFYNYGFISTNETALAFQLESLYVKPSDVPELQDAIYEDAGFKDKQYVDPKDISMDYFTEEDQSPLRMMMSPDIQSPVHATKRAINEKKNTRIVGFLSYFYHHFCFDIL